MEPILPPSLRQTLRDFADLAHPSFWIAPEPDKSLPRGDGHSVLFAPGAACNDLIMTSVRKFYRSLGYDTQPWRLGFNIGPTKRIMLGLENRLFSLNDRSGRRVSLVGKSLGGMLVRELAKKHPDRVRRLILVCAPVRHPIASRAASLFYAMERFFNSSIPGSHEQLSRPARVPTTAFFTKRDGLLAWQCCLEQPGPLAENIELPDAYHSTAAMHPQALRIMAERLAAKDIDNLAAKHRTPPLAP